MFIQWNSANNVLAKWVIVLWFDVITFLKNTPNHKKIIWMKMKMVSSSHNPIRWSVYLFFYVTKNIFTDDERSHILAVWRKPVSRNIFMIATTLFIATVYTLSFCLQLCVLFSFFAVSIVLFLVSRFSPHEWRSVSITDTHLDHPISSANEVMQLVI